MRETPRDPDDTSELRPRSRWKVHPFQAVASQSVGPRSKDLEMLDLGPGSGSDPVGFIYLESPEEKGGRQGATSHSGKHADICRLTPSCRSVKPAKKEATEAPVERNSGNNAIIAPGKSFATSLGSTMQHLTQAASGLDETVVTSFHHVNSYYTPDN